MMKINFIQPDESKEFFKECQALVEQMTKLLARLKSGHKYSILTAKNRLTLMSEGYCKRLIDNLVFITERIKVWDTNTYVQKDVLMTGFTHDAFNPNFYAGPSIRETLIESHKGRCAYCETLIQQDQYGVVDHFRPIEGYMEQNSDTLFRPGYYFLAYDLQNLFYTCEICSRACKGSYFPVIGKRVPNIGVTNELSALINIYEEDPRDFIRFNPLNGEAYPFDMVSRFYSDIENMGKEAMEQEIWKDPTMIPSQYNYKGELLSNKDINNAYESWMGSSKNNTCLQRGKLTIGTLRLNRKDLVRSRVSHLRQLRGLYWTKTAATGSDQSAAQKLLDLFTTSDPENIVDAPQYLSLTIDSINTWNKTNLNTSADWITTYNAIIKSFVTKKDILEPKPHDNTLMYLVLKSEFHLKTKRRIISLSADDKIYAHDSGLVGVFLNINWKQDLGNQVIITGRGGETKMTLQELLNNSHEIVLNIFKNNEVWVLGNYVPLSPETAVKN